MAAGTVGPGLRSMSKYLHPREQVVTEIRHHRVVLLKPLGILLAVTVVALWIDASTPDASLGTLPRLAWATWIAVAAWAVWQVFEWRHTRVVVTSKRIMLFEGFITRRVSMMPLSKVTDMSYDLTVPGRILGYGHFVLESAGQDQALSSIDFVPDPDGHYQDIIGQIFGLEDEDGPDDGHGHDLGDEDEPDEDDRERRGRARRREQLRRRSHEEDAQRREEWELEKARRERRQRRADYLAQEQQEELHPPHLRTGRGDPSIYRSADLVRRDRDADTGELPPYTEHDTGELPPYDDDWRP
ncbi:hypothetical protein GCM10027055_08660 [Janibacter alkaliphilus]